MLIVSRSYANTAKLFESPFFYRRLLVTGAVVGLSLAAKSVEIYALGAVFLFSLLAFTLGLPIWPFVLALGVAKSGSGFYALTVALAVWTIVRFHKRPKLSPADARTFQIQHPEVRSRVSFGYAWQLTLCAPDKPRAAAEAIARIETISSLEGGVAFYLANVLALTYFFAIGYLISTVEIAVSLMGAMTLIAAFAAIFLAPIFLKMLSRSAAFLKEPTS